MGSALSKLQYTVNNVSSKLNFSAATSSDKFCPLYYILKITYNSSSTLQVNSSFG